MAVQFKASRTNMLPVASSTNQVCPHTVFTGRPINVRTDVTYGFGDLVEALKKDTNNSMASRTDQLIAGVPRMNSTGTSYGFSLITGRIVTRTWTLHTVSTPTPGGHTPGAPR